MTEEKHIMIGNREVYCCSMCPRNFETPNPIWKRLPPVHTCKDMFDVNSPAGRPIYVPHIIPKWCPYANN